jgi:diacylglycerol kinase family enzyme
VETTSGAPGTPTRVAVAQRWLARLALAAAAAAVLLMLGVAGAKSLAVVAVGVAGLGLTAAGVWWALTRRGVLRLLAVGLAVAAPLAVLVLYVLAHLALVVLGSLALWAGAVTAGRAALGRDPGPGRMPEYEVAAPKRPFLIMNPRSGGGRVARFGLQERAEALGAEVALLGGGGPGTVGTAGTVGTVGTVDVAEVARRAVAGGADLLGVAGGDGTQALVAGVAAEHDVPLLVIPAGTRNHFALDLGLDRDDPSGCLDALRDGVELRVDLGVIGGRPFVNNASFGAYAAVVQSPAYRDDKARTTLDMLPGLLAGHRGPHLRAHAGRVSVHRPAALLVSNNPYGMGDIAGLGRRARLDGGVLGVLGVRVDNATQAAGVVGGRHSRGLTVLAADQVVVTADVPHLPVGVDGEALSLPTPVRCTVRPGALRVRVPRNRPGVPLPKPPVNWRRLGQLAATTARSAGTGTAP